MIDYGCDVSRVSPVLCKHNFASRYGHFLCVLWTGTGKCITLANTNERLFACWTRPKIFCNRLSGVLSLIKVSAWKLALKKKNSQFSLIKLFKPTNTKRATIIPFETTTRNITGLGKTNEQFEFNPQRAKCVTLYLGHQTL